MNRIRPRVTGVFFGLALAAWGGLEDANRPPSRIMRWSLVGLGSGVLATHLLQRVDEVIDSKRFARKKKLQILARAVQSQARFGGAGATVEESDIFEKSLDSTMHFSPNVFSDSEVAADDESNGRDKASKETDLDEKPAPLDFETACERNDFLAALETYRESLSKNVPLYVTPETLARIRSDALNKIFQRMHSGTVKQDVAHLAVLIVELFPESKEGRTLGPVLGVLRRAAGLCPRCAKPYKGIANACHECLKGTAEAYQIAWDD